MRDIVHITNQFKREVKFPHIYSKIRNVNINFQIDTKLAKLVINHRVIINCMQQNINYISTDKGYLHYYQFSVS